MALSGIRTRASRRTPPSLHRAAATVAVVSIVLAACGSTLTFRASGASSSTGSVVHMVAAENFWGSTPARSAAPTSR